MNAFAPRRAGAAAVAVILLAAASPMAVPRMAALFAEETAPTDDFAGVRARAEAAIAQGSFAQAHALYAAVDRAALGPDEARFVAFRVADTQWRAAASSENPDTSVLDAARAGLEAMARELDRPEEKDRIHAEIQESLGDLLRGPYDDAQAALEHDRAALDFWAGAVDLDLARTRYLAIVFRASEPEQHRRWWSIDPSLGIETFEAAARIASTPEERGRANYLLAEALGREQGDDGTAPNRRRRAIAALEAVIAAGDASRWFDDALMALAQRLETSGAPQIDEQGRWVEEPDYVRALALYRRIDEEFDEGESPHVDDARERIGELTRTRVGLAVEQVFLPGSKVAYTLHWRNAKRVELALHPVDLPRDVDLDDDQGAYQWLEDIDLDDDPVREWTLETASVGATVEHAPYAHAFTLDGELAAGAYVLEARAGRETAREIVLVSDATLVLKVSGKTLLAWFCAAEDGEPIAGARVAFCERWQDGDDWEWRETEATTGDDGIARIARVQEKRVADVFAAAALGRERQAFAFGHDWRYRNDADTWRIWAATDRPAYRPGDLVQWKLTARVDDGERYRTPAGESLRVRVTDPKGAVVREQQAALNEFGSGSGDLETTPSMALGLYRAEFLRGEENVGWATLFRLEEYKLPEFLVTVAPAPGEGGKPRPVRLGERVQAEVSAQYTFGGPVAGATVEVVVRQKPFVATWHEPRRYPWYFEEPGHRGHDGGTEIARQTLATGADGKAQVQFDTPLDAGTDLEFEIEARVTDASRREIRGTGSVKATRQDVYVHLTPRGRVHRPGEPVDVAVKAIDPNGDGVAIEGHVTVARARWRETWIDPRGETVVIDAEQGESAAPPSDVRAPGWKLRESGYVYATVEEFPAATDARGDGAFRFTPPREGYFAVTFTAKDGRGAQVKGEAHVFACTDASTRLGYHTGGVDVVVDGDSFRVGAGVPVLIATAQSGRHVLFTVEAEEFLQARVVHVTGNAKLVTLGVEQNFVPNVFLAAFTMSGGVAHADVEEVVVPPEESFLGVDVTLDAESYAPGGKARLGVRATDHAGEPVSAELTISVIDASVLYIQDELAPDPRRFFHGEKRERSVRQMCTTDAKPYARLREIVRGEGKGLFDQVSDRFAQLDDRATNEELRRLGYAGGTGGRFGGRGAKGAVAARAAAPAGLIASAVQLDQESFDRDLGLGGAQAGEIEVRRDFRETALFVAAVVTDADGRATLEVDWPDSTTTWKATARAFDRGTRVGIGNAEARTTKPLLVRLQAPRFFTAGDEVVLSAIVNNATGDALDADVSLEIDGGLEVLGRVGHDGALPVAAGGEARADWNARAVREGPVALRVIGRAGANGPSDAMERRFIVHPHGVEALAAASGKLAASRDELVLSVDLPPERRAAETRFAVQVAPSLAVTMLDALPYLVRYPYGCTEQTLSRFVPAVIVARTLQERGLSPGDAMARVFGGVERATAEQTHDADGRASLDELDAVVADGLARLADFQHGDGGWGWWKDGDSDPFMTAYVVWGLSLAVAADLDVDLHRLQRGAKWLDANLVEAESRVDEQAWLLHALAVYGATVPGGHATEFAGVAFANLWEKHASLNAYGRALFALAAHHLGRDHEAAVLAGNLANGVIRDAAPESSILAPGSERRDAAGDGAALATAHWGEDGVRWHWSQGGIEATAFAVRALLAIDPDNALIEPAVTWLVKNRRAAQWSNTRDTAIVLLALNDWLSRSGELARDVAYEVAVNGNPVASESLAARDLLRAPASFDVPADLLQDGANEVRVRRTGGSGALYAAAYAHFFDRQEPVAARGSELFVRRDYHRLVPRPTLLKGVAYDRVPLADGATVTSGDRIEVTLTIEAKNHLEYLVFEDLKPAGLEAAEIQSGTPLFVEELKQSEIEQRFGGGEDERRVLPSRRGDETGATGRRRWVHQELRDRHVALFVDKLPQGTWQVRYDLRAEVPGRFHALPVLGHAMYVPEIRCNGAELRIDVADR